MTLFGLDWIWSVLKIKSEIRSDPSGLGKTRPKPIQILRFWSVFDLDWIWNHSPQVFFPSYMLLNSQTRKQILFPIIPLPFRHDLSSKHTIHLSSLCSLSRTFATMKGRKTIEWAPTVGGTLPLATLSGPTTKLSMSATSFVVPLTLSLSSFCHFFPPKYQTVHVN